MQDPVNKCLLNIISFPNKEIDRLQVLEGIHREHERMNPFIKKKT